MCEANVYLVNQGREELVMEAVDLVRPEGPDNWHLENIFGDQKVICGRIREMRLVDHRIVFESKTEPGSGDH